MEEKKEKDESVQKNQTVRSLFDHDEDFPGADENLSDEEYFQKYLANGKADSDALIQEQEAFTEAVQKELRLETSREQQRLESDPSLAGQEPSPELLDRILVGMEVIRERENGSCAAGEAAKMAACNAKAETCADRAGDSETNGNVPCTNGMDSEKAAYNPEAYLSEEDRRALEIGRRRLRRPMRRKISRILGAVAAVFVCVLVVSVSSEANRVRIANAFNVLIGKETFIKINNEENRNEFDLREKEARAEIEEKVGIKPVQFMYNTKHLIFDGYEIKEESSKAGLFYQYQDTIFTIYMEKKEEGTARGDSWDGDIQESFEVESVIGDIKVLELQAENENKYFAEFFYDNVYYKIYGALPREEFVKIIESLFF